MGYRFGSKVVLTNAFHAANDVRNCLSLSDIEDFCSLVKAELRRALFETGEPESCGVTFDFDDGFMASPDSGVKQVAGLLLRHGGPVTEDELRGANLCLEGQAARLAFSRARDRFAGVLREDGRDSRTLLADAVDGQA